MADFDPDAYLADTAGPAEAPSSGTFDPDAYLSNFNPDAYLQGSNGTDQSSQDNNARPPSVAPENAVARGVRNVAHGVAPAVGGYYGAGVGAEAGAALGSLAGPIGTGLGAIAGGLAGAFGGGYVGEKIAHTAQDAVGLNDDPQMQANREAHPTEAAIEQALPSFAGMRFDKGASVAARLASGAMQTGIDAAQQYANDGHVNPAEALAIGALGAVFPATNRVGERIVGAGQRTAKRFIPGRPGAEANPAADIAHAAVDDPSVETAVGDSVLAEAPPSTRDAQTAATGNPQSAPTRSSREYAKDSEQQRYADALSDPEAMRQFAHEEGLTEAQAREIAQANYEQPRVTTGNISPDVAAALDASQPEKPPAQSPSEAQAQTTQTIGTSGDIDATARAPARRATRGIKYQTPPEPVVDAGFPQPGEPVAAGSEATPLPPEMPAMAAEAIKKSKAAQGTTASVPFMITKEMKAKLGAQGYDTEAIRSMTPDQAHTILNSGAKAPVRGDFPPEIKGETVANDTLSDAQKDAGNYKKARTHDFGKPIAIETHAGDTRRSPEGHPEPWENKSPYEYGYFNKTKGPDGDHIDFMRPAEGAPELGDKHYIIDQKDAKTGKYDEPKVMTYVKDEATARDLYNRGFSDNKGPDRLHDITEVSRGDLVKYLTKHTTSPPTKPYGKPISKPLNQRAGVLAAAEKLKAKGNVEGAEKLLAAPDEALAGKVEGLRARKYGVSTGASAGYPIEGRVGPDGKPVTANSAAKAKLLSAEHKKLTDWFENSAPNSQLKEGAESNGELLDRLQGAPTPKQSVFAPKEWMLAREAKKVLAKPTPGNVKKYREAERLLRGSDQDVQNYRDGNLVEGSIARSRRGGDEAIASAESKLHQTGVNSEEDAIIDSIDRARRGEGKFDVPHEEAEEMVKPKAVKTKADLKEPANKTIDVTESALAKAPPKKPERFITLKDGTKERVEAPTNEVKQTTKPKLSPEESAKLLEQLNKATQRKGLSDDSIASYNTRADAPLFENLGKGFLGDESGSANKVDFGELKKAFDKLLRYTDLTRFVDNMKKTEHTSYLAKKSGGVRDDYIRSLDERLHKVGKEDVNHNVGILTKAFKEWPKDTLDAAARERVFEARDADSAHVDLPGKLPGKTNVESLPAALKAAYDKHLDPVFSGNDQFHTAIHAADPTAIGPAVPHHIAHIMNGDTSQFNMLRGKDDPMEQGHYRGLAVNASAAENRKYFALDRDADHTRFVVEPTDTGYSIWQNGKESRIKDPSFEFEDGKKFSVTAKDGTKIDYTMRQAMAKEKEANVTINKKPIKYYHDAGFAALVTNAQLGSMARHMEALQRIKDTPGWKDWTTTKESSKQVKDEGWAESNMPNFKGTYMHPDLKALFDDFAGQPQTDFQRLNAAVTKLIFVSPTKHAITNVGGHAVASRGWDNLSIPKNLAILKDLPTAISSVLHQDRYQRRLNLSGSGTVYGKTITKDMPGQLAKAFGLDIERNPSKWGPVADTLGVPLLDLTNSIYRASQKAMWAGSDVWMTLRVRELQRKGMPMRQAIIDSERDIPNYRSPTKLFGNRWAAQTFFNNSVFAFSRYHFGMVNAYAHIVKDMLGTQATMGDRVEAAGKLMTIGLMGMVLYPLLDQGWKKLTGNPHAEAARGGPLTIPSHVVGAAKGKDDIMAPVRSAATISPLVSGALETLSNRDWRGKPIVEPGDVRQAVQGHVPAIARTVGTAGEHLARTLVAPYNMYATQAKKSPPGDRGAMGQVKALGRTIRDQALDIKDVSPAAAKYEAGIAKTNNRDVNARFKRGGNGPFENLLDRVFGR